MQKGIPTITHRILVLIRSEIENKSNAAILGKLIDSMQNENTQEELIYSINQISPLYSEMLGASISIEDNRTLTPKQEKIYTYIMEYALGLIYDQIMKTQYEYAYDIVDCIHAFPDVFIKADKKTLKRYWKIYIEPIRKKWDGRLFDEVCQYFGRP